MSPPGGPPVPPGTVYFYPAAANGSSWCWMQRGNHSTAVWALQWTLNECYFAGIAQDWDFGPATERALRTAQARSGATVDGGYGPNTRALLKYISTAGPAYCNQLFLVGIG